ncbi:Voltage-dependent T-type calcium channel subunit alpha-1H [Symbiodinium microadriaticum]|uniref:Voltage-dependent T-type calcium channel subunit alpha-1H n=1 Tax=Symbiodinium microadriaticum TaxID=2951 RepID=A0A1Q9CWI4_SYMMI|nr:Voltage-dependent T-type calcium channel subunit alpha-1H [Symbiodinium microadriaticum]
MCCCRRREGLTEACCRPVDKDGQRIPWIHSPASDVFFTVLIVLGTILLGVDIELGLRQVAEAWSVMKGVDSRTPGMPFDKHNANIRFGLLLVFVLELFLRVCTDGCRYFLSLANLLDAFIIFCSLAEYVVVAAIGQGVLLNTLAVMRIFRLLRILRVIRLVRVCPQLYSICINLVSAIRAVSWVFLLLFVFMYISALSCTVLLAGAKDDIIRTNFGSVFASIYIHFVILTVEGFPEIVAAIAEEFGWLWYVYFVGYILFTNIMIMNTVTGVICQTVVSHSAMDAGVKAQSYREFEKLKEVVLDCMVLEGKEEARSSFINAFLPIFELALL